MIAILLSALMGAATGPVEDLAALDRTTQAAAVEAIARDETVDVAELMELWRSTSRFDLRAHIAQALGRLGPRGAQALLELNREPLPERLEGEGDVIISALAAGGASSLEAAIAECAQPSESLPMIPASAATSTSTAQHAPGADRRATSVPPSFARPRHSSRPPANPSRIVAVFA